jgi:broad specificity phosphatase PhoE
LTTTLYLIRHGATEQNEARPVTLQGCGIDGPLSATGRKQAAQLAMVLSQIPLCHVYSSPMLRARQTAVAIADLHGLAVETVEELYEVDVGDWEGRSWDEIMRDDGDAYARFMEKSDVIPYSGGESYTDVLQRARPAMLKLLFRHAEQSIALVAHNVVNRTLLADLLRVPLHFAKDIPQSNGCINVIRRKGERVELVTLNAELPLLTADPASSRPTPGLQNPGPDGRMD